MEYKFVGLPFKDALRKVRLLVWIWLVTCEEKLLNYRKEILALDLIFVKIHRKLLKKTGNFEKQHKDVKKESKNLN